jgi:hypothetical protein
MLMAGFKLLEGGFLLAGLGALCIQVACSSQANERKAEILLPILTSTLLLAGVLTVLNQLLVALSQNNVITGLLSAATVGIPFPFDPELIVTLSTFGSCLGSVFGAWLQWFTVAGSGEGEYRLPTNITLHHPLLKMSCGRLLPIITLRPSIPSNLQWYMKAFLGGHLRS